MDLQPSGSIDASDLAQLLLRWTDVCHALDHCDWDGDRACNADDLAVLLMNWD
jgi:hypothetical protein